MDQRVMPAPESPAFRPGEGPSPTYESKTALQGLVEHHTAWSTVISHSHAADRI